MKIFEQLQDFNPIHKREVQFADKTLTFYFREQSADEAENFSQSITGDKKKDKGARNRYLAAVVCEEDGTLGTAADFGKLPNGLANALQEIAMEINGLGEKAKADAKNE